MSLFLVSWLVHVSLYPVSNDGVSSCMSISITVWVVFFPFQL
jgi:hypothetical protein